MHIELYSVDQSKPVVEPSRKGIVLFCDAVDALVAGNLIPAGTKVGRCNFDPGLKAPPGFKV